MAEDFRQRAVFRSRGRLFEDFEVGQEFVHHWGRTITESDTVLFSTMLLHFNPIYFNRDYAKAQGHPDIVRLFPDFTEMEEKYYAATKVWPIMHIITLQKHVLDANPWVARNLFNAFLLSKNRSVERLMDPAVSRYPVASLPTYMRKTADR